MGSYSADEQVVHPYRGQASMNQGAFSFPAQHQGNQFQRQTFSQSNATGLVISNDNYGDNGPAGLGLTSNAASQLMKRSRTNSDEPSQGLLPQILGLLSRASSDDQQKILLFLKGDMMALSSDSNLRHVSHNSLSQPTRHDLMPDLLQPFNSSSNQTISPAVLAATGNFDQRMQWTGPIQDSNPTNDEEQFNSNYSEFQPNYSVPARVSMPIQSTTYHAPLPSRLYKSQPPLTDSAASTAAAFIIRQKLIGNVQDLNRDSMQTLSSYNSVDTDTTLVTRPSSTSTLSSQASQPPRKLPPQRTMSSAFSSKKTHHRISSTGSSSSSTPAPRIPCTVPSCSTTFGRPSDRDRHMSSQHDMNSGFTCLLHTCSKFCPDNCSNKEHTRPPLSGSRQDKMKEHLEKVHGRKLKTMNDVPAAFENVSHFKREKRGWRCGTCEKWLGSWWDEGLDGEGGGKQMIQRHASGSCFGGSMTVSNGEDELELQTALKRLSVEDPLARNGLGLGMGLNMDKALPRKPVVDTPEMRAWMAGYIHDVDAERDLHSAQ